MDKQYYKNLVERWFDAETTEAEEQELRRFLAGTDDPAFDEARAAMGYLAAEKAVATVPAAEQSSSPALRFWPVVGVAASLALAFLFGRMSAPVEVVPVDNGSCVSYVHGVKVRDEVFAVESMENTLTELFSASADPGAELSRLFNTNE